MDITQITAVIGAGASLLCTLVVGALTYFMKRTLASLEDADKRNAEALKDEVRERERAIREEARRREESIKEESRERERIFEKLTETLGKLQMDIPRDYALRSDLIRITNNMEDKITGMDQKIDRVLNCFTTERKEE